jgi:hypothetical protein
VELGPTVKSVSAQLQQICPRRGRSFSDSITYKGKTPKGSAHVEGFFLVIRTDAELKEIAAVEPFRRSPRHGGSVNIIFLGD